MTSLHPHWQTTDEDEQPVRVSISAPVQSEMQNDVPRAKRTPAALIGVVLFLVIGFVLFKGTTDFSGQVAETDIEIMITPVAVDPEILTVKAGQTIKWINKSGIPQILESDEIYMPNGEPFKTTAIFPDAEFTFAIPEGVPAGIYEYESNTSAMIKGQIIVEESIQTALPVSSESMDQGIASSQPAISSSSVPVQIPVAVSSFSSASSSAQSVAPAAIVGGIPVNPHTIGSSYVPVEQNLHQGAPRSSTASIAKHTPVSQPTTGMGVWTAAIMGVLALIGVLIRARRIA